MTERPPTCPGPEAAAAGQPCPDLPRCRIARTLAAPSFCRGGLMSMPRPVLLTDDIGPQSGRSPDTRSRPRGRRNRPEEALHDVA